ncbi:MAG: polysaccharide deacetylase family protein [Cyanobacteria bacterium J06638_28]
MNYLLRHLVKPWKLWLLVGWFVVIATLLLPPQWVLTRVLPPIACPGAVYAVQTTAKVVALTIDDGPDLRVGAANSTEQILNILQQHNQQHPEATAHATFFLIGNQVRAREQASQYPQDGLTARMIQEGHEVANHMMEDSASILLEERFEDVFWATHQRLLPYAELPESQYPAVQWLRPGVGWCDRAMSQAVATHASYRSETGQPQIVLGSVWPYDTVQPWPQFSRWFVRHNVQPGSIIILHDFGQRGDRTATMLANMLQDLWREDYRVLPLSKLLSYGEPVKNAARLPGRLERLRRAIILGLENLR